MWDSVKGYYKSMVEANEILEEARAVREAYRRGEISKAVHDRRLERLNKALQELSDKDKKEGYSRPRE